MDVSFLDSCDHIAYSFWGMLIATAFVNVIHGLWSIHKGEDCKYVFIFYLHHFLTDFLLEQCVLIVLAIEENKFEISTGKIWFIACLWLIVLLYALHISDHMHDSFSNERIALLKKMCFSTIMNMIFLFICGSCLLQ